MSFSFFCWPVVYFVFSYCLWNFSVPELRTLTHVTFIIKCILSFTNYILNDKKKDFFFYHHAVENGRFLACKKVFNCTNLLNGSIQIEFHHSVFLLMVERLGFQFSPKINETDYCYSDPVWLNHTAYLRKEPGNPQCFLEFLS